MNPLVNVASIKPNARNIRRLNGVARVEFREIAARDIQDDMYNTKSQYRFSFSFAAPRARYDLNDFRFGITSMFTAEVN